jgi:NodT family efflux transporter outer membrane factor (OMF) lipoprotein
MIQMHNINKGRGYLLLIGITLIGISSCRSYKNLPEVPQAETTGLFRDSAANNIDTTNIANIPWKEYFVDAKLQALIAEGLNNNMDLKIAMQRIQQAEANFSMSRGALLPSVSAGLQMNHTRTSAKGGETNVLGYYSNVTSLGFSASWEIDLWGKLNNQSKAKYANYLNSFEYRNLVQTTLIANIAKAYYSLIALDEQLKITRQTIGLLEKSTQTIAELKEAGLQNAAAVEQSRALLYNTQISVPQLETQIRKQEDVICFLLGRVPGGVDRDSIATEVVAPNLQYGVPAQMLAKRPDVKQAEFSFRAAYAITNAAKANFYPSLTITNATLGLASGGFADLFKPESVAAQLMAGLTQPIFNKRQIRGNYKIAQAQKEEALLNFKSVVLAAGQEVSDILFGFNASLRKNEYREKQITSLTNAVDFTQDLLAAGEANYTEVLNAQQSLLNAQLNRVNDKLEQLTYSVSLYKALGGGTK